MNTYDEDMTAQTYNGIGGGFGALASAFVIESLEHMVVWLIVMAVVVFTDLVTGISKAVKLREKIRFSKAVRDSMGKFCTYFAVVVCACMIQVASQYDYEFDKYVCLVVIIIESISIFGNICKINGYMFDGIKLVQVIAAKRLELDRKDLDGVIRKEKKDDNKRRVGRKANKL